jgi:hypothetical protein
MPDPFIVALSVMAVVIGLILISTWMYLNGDTSAHERLVTDYIKANQSRPRFDTHLSCQEILRCFGPYQLYFRYGYVSVEMGNQTVLVDKNGDRPQSKINREYRARALPRYERTSFDDYY